MALLLTLIGSCEAYSLLTTPRIITQRANGASMDANDFRFGCGKQMSSTVIGYQVRLVIGRVASPIACATRSARRSRQRRPMRCTVAARTKRSCW